MMDIPAYPKDLPPADRSTLADGAADRLTKALIADAPRGMMKAKEEMLVGMIASLIVRQRWADERINELERQANG